MSWSSGSSPGPSFRAAAGRRTVADSRSPVVYRENPMAYTPDRFCRCNPQRKAPRWISWSRQNPGRRYFACVDAMNGGGCGYVEWYDPAWPKFLTELLGDLRDEVWRLRGQGSVPPCTEAAGGDGSVLALQDELRMKNAEIAALKGKFEGMVFLFVVFVVGLVAGKMLLQ